MDKATDFYSVRCGFDSCRGCQIMNEVTKEQRDKSDASFKILMAQLPHNTESVYLELQLSDCKLYVPSGLGAQPEKLQREKRAYKTLIYYAGY